MTDKPLQSDGTDIPSVSQTVDGIIDFDAYAIAAIERGERDCAIAALMLAQEIDKAMNQRAADHFARAAALERLQAMSEGDRERVSVAVHSTIDRITEPSPPLTASTLTVACGLPFARKGYTISGTCGRPRGHAGHHRR